uniref:Uncharacterized protein n=1 Tax=Arundo donax TaxID=35708 RepID=A0A0A9CLV2_ARUDO
MLISRVGSLPGDIDALGGMIIQYPDAEAPPPSPPPQPPVP